MMRLKLTSAQQSALDCAGARWPEGAAEIALDAAWRGSVLIVTDENREHLWRAIIDFCNGEDDVAEDRNRDADERHGARGACRALGNLASKII